MEISKSLINNVRETKVTSYLRNIGVTRADDEKELDSVAWFSKLLDENRVSCDIFNDCLWRELMYGHRRFIRIYSLKSVRKIKRLEDWNDFNEKYNCPSMNFNQIVQTTMASDEKIKVCAMKTEVENDVIKRISILFAFNMDIRYRENGSVGKCISYIPVTMDLVEKVLTIKVWNKDDALEGSTPTDQLNNIYERLMKNLDFETKAISVDPQTVLYKMSKALFDDFFRKLPNTAEVEAKRDSMPELVDSLLKNISLENSEIKNEKKTMNSDVINVEDELYKLLQQVALYDYLKDNEIKALLENTDKYISRIRFSDRDNLTASLTSETGVKCIFDAKTFMCVRNSLDLVERIVSIVVAFANSSSKGLLLVKYDASDRTFLNIHILNNRYYTEEDYKMIWELYKIYESEDYAAISVVRDEDNAEAM